MEVTVKSPETCKKVLEIEAQFEDFKETIEKAWKLAKELDIRGTSFPIAVPFPGTRLRAMAERGEYGLRITSNNWEDYGKQYPGVMEQGELTVETCLFYQQKSYLNHPVKWDYDWPEDELDRTKRLHSQAEEILAC